MPGFICRADSGSALLRLHKTQARLKYQRQRKQQVHEPVHEL
jgi:hypothetical protein